MSITTTVQLIIVELQSTLFQKILAEIFSLVWYGEMTTCHDNHIVNGGNEQ